MEENRLIKKYKIKVKAYNFGEHYGTHVDIQDNPPSDQDIINAIIGSRLTLKYGTRDASVEEIYLLTKDNEQYRED